MSLVDKCAAILKFTLVQFKQRVDKVKQNGIRWGGGGGGDMGLNWVEK